MLPRPQPPKPDGVFPAAQLTCTNDDPTCDFGAPGDGACHFLVAFCLNVPDPRLACTPTDVTTVEVMKPKIDFNDPTAYQNHYAIAAAFTALGPEERHCTAPAAAVGTQCFSDADCGVGGKCGKANISANPPFGAPSHCTDYVTIDVPLKNKKGVYVTGKSQVSLRITTSPDAASKVHKDTDKLKLVCNP
jgi:hypothetical protein